MDKFQDVKELAIESGFNKIGELDTSTIIFREEVRATCAENKCGAYGTNWSCPPGCGTLSQGEEKVRKYSKGLILQTSGELEDAFDAETMIMLAENHDKALDTFNAKLKEIYPDAIVIGAGACTICKKCTYPDEPCRFPNRMVYSMEALGMVVSDVCKANDIPYYYGPNTLTYVGCVLLE